MICRRLCEFGNRRGRSGVFLIEMKPRLLLLALLLAAPLLHADELTGLIAYGDCAEDGKTTVEEHAKCAKDKNRDFQVLVFVNRKDKKTYELVDEDQVEQFIGKEVKIDGRLEDGFVIIDKVEPAK